MVHPCLHGILLLWYNYRCVCISEMRLIQQWICIIIAGAWSNLPRADE